MDMNARTNKPIRWLLALYLLLSFSVQGLAQNEPAPEVIDANFPTLTGTQEEKLEAIVSLALVKLMRMRYATILSHSDLIISELDSYPDVVSNIRRLLTKHDLDPKTADELLTQEIETEIELHKLVIMAESGLLDRFERQAPVLLREELEPRVVAAVNLTGYRAAARQNRLELAERYLKAARAALNREGDERDPILEYAARTAEFGFRQLKGGQATVETIGSEFQKAWAALKTYQPLTMKEQDLSWSYGRLATRAWVDMMAPHPEASREAILTIANDITAWVSLFDTWKPDTESVDGLLQVFDMVAMAVASADQITYLCAAIPEATDSTEALKGFEEVVVSLLSPQEQMQAFTGPGFPSYELSNGGLIPELLARCRYIDTFDQSKTPEQRLQLLDIGVAKIKEARNPEAAVDYLLAAGQRFAELKSYERAIASWQSALEIAQKLSFIQRQVDAATLLAKEYGRRQDWDRAGHYAGVASGALEKSVPGLSVRSEQGQAAVATAQELTDLSVKAAVASEDPEKALVALTRGQQVQSATYAMEGQKEAQAQAQQLQRQESQVAALSVEVQRLEEMPDSPTRNALLGDAQSLLADGRAKFLAESRKLRQNYSELYNRVLRFDPLNLPEVQKNLPADLAVVQYFSTQDALYIFVVTAENFRLRNVPVTNQVLESSSSLFTRSVRKGVANDPVVAAESRKLYDWLIAPVAKDLSGKSTLVLIPSGRLYSVPFASLTDATGAPLAQSKKLLELAKTTDLTRIPGDKPEPIQHVVAFANATGDLPAASLEGKRIAALFPDSQLFEGAKATKDAFTAYGGKGQALHLATHGEWNIENSLSNFLAMAGNQQVRQDEIFSLDLADTSLVILSACNTAMGEGGGEVKYVASLAEAFWLAGSRSVVASLWAVNDESTSLLMTEFYQNLKEGQSKAEALRVAQMTVRDNPKFQHPYYWAGFILFGDWQ